MKKKYLKTLLIICISTASIYMIARACGDWWGNDDSGFTPEAFVDSAYKPFFYSGDFYYSIGHDTQHDSRFNEKNVEDWKVYFDNKVPAEELDYYLYSAPLSEIDSVNDYFNKKIKYLPEGSLSFLMAHQKNGLVQKFFTYLKLAKDCEKFAVNDFQYKWDYSSEKSIIVEPSFIENTSQKIKELFEKENDNFIKQRYWFQLVRAYFFSKSWESCISFFTNYKNSFSKNDIYYRAMAYMAGAYYKQGDYAKANYYYSLVFNGCDAMKMPAHWSFHPQEESDWNETLAMCANDEEKTTLWQMLGVFYGDEMRSIKEIYKLNTKSEKLNLLLLRYVNIKEQNFNFELDYYYGYYYTTPDKPKDSSDNANLSQIGLIADAGNTQKPYLWQMAYAYLNFLRGKTDVAAKYLVKADNAVPKEALPQAQLRLLKLVVKVSQAKTIDVAFETSVLKDFEWLRTFNDSTMPEFRHNGLWSWVRNAMATKYNRQKEWVKAECFRHSSSFFNDNAKIEGLKSLKTNASPSPYNRLCANLCNYSYSDLVEFQAINETFQNDLDNAIAKMQQVKSPTVLAGNPFNGSIKDCHDCDHVAPQKIKYNKLSFLLKMKEMKDKLTAGQDVYNNARLLANAHYNITHFGNARYFYECNIIGGGFCSPYSIDSVFVNKLTDMSKAKYYYTIALKAAQTDEQKALCQYMLAKCERNEWFCRTVYNNKENEWKYREEETDFIEWKGFKALKEQYANTAYYKEVIKECGWFNTYSKIQPARK